MIESVIQHVLSRTRPSSGDDLLGFTIDADYFFGECDLLAEATVAETREPSCMLELSAMLRPHVSALHQVRHALADIWQNLHYQHFEATAWTFDPRAVSLRFVTVVSGGQFCVTGRMRVGGPHYERLHRKGK